MRFVIALVLFCGLQITLASAGQSKAGIALNQQMFMHTDPSSSRITLRNIDSLLVKDSLSTPNDLPHESFQRVTGSLTRENVQGHALWYRLDLSEFRGMRDPVLFIPRVRYQMLVFYNERQIYNFGISKTGSRSFNGSHHHTISLPELESKSYLYIKVVSNLKSLGLLGPLSVGEAVAHETWMWLEDLPKYLVGIVFLVLGFLFLTLRLGRFSEPVFFPFAAFSITFGVFTLGRSYTRTHFLINDELLWDYIQTMALFQVPAGLIWLIMEAIASQKEKSLLQWLAWSHFYYGVCAIALVLMGFTALGSVILPFQVFLLVSAASVLIYTIRKAYQGDTNAKLLSEAFAFMSLTAIHDAATQLGFFPWQEMISHYASLIFLIYLGMIIKNRVVVSLNRHYHMRHELETTGFLQEKILPTKDFANQFLSLRIYSSSAEAAGGDFFAYYPLGDDLFDLHIGDVTGHSTAASLLTAYIKGQLDQFYSGNFGNNELNGLHDQLNHNLVAIGGRTASTTLLSVRLDFQRGEYSYTNSGHPQMLILGEAVHNPSQLRRRNSCILGVLDQFQAKVAGPFPLPKEGCFLLVSDGLLEGLGEGGLTQSQFRERMIQLFGQGDPSSFADRLGRLSQELGKQDDVTFLVVRFRENSALLGQGNQAASF